MAAVAPPGDELAGRHVRVRERCAQHAPHRVELPRRKPRRGGGARGDAQQVLGVLVDEGQLPPLHLHRLRPG
eukprot:1684801-Rhodomonas_salina.1